MMFLQIILLLLVCQERSCADESSLKKLQIIFRHGFRTPDKLAYGHFEDCYHDVNPGELTKLGRSQMSYLGYFLRMRYNTFIGADPNQTHLLYSDYPRNLDSAKLVFNALFSEYNHSGVEFRKIDPDVDGPLETSEDYYEDSYEWLLRKQEYAGLMKRISETNLVRIPMDNLYRVYLVADQLLCEIGNSCPPPKWMSTSLKEELVDMNAAYFRAFKFCKNEKIVKENSDLMIKELIKVFDPRNSDSTFKVYLYSLHDTNIVPLLSRLGLYDGLVVPFGAFLAFELHSPGETSQEDQVRILYYNSTDYVSPPCNLKPSASHEIAGLPYSHFVQMATGRFSCLSE